MTLQDKITARESTVGSSVGPKIYRAGSLRYTLSGIVVLFGWLLWGDFCFTIFESIFGKFLPLYMKDLDASNKMIGIMTGSIGGIVNVLFLPNISMASDRHRGRWGRRIPFLFWSTPCAVGALVLIGFSTELGGWLHRGLASLPWQISLSAVTLGLLTALVAGYHFFNMVLVNIYNCLLRDVVPPELMARFLAMFRVVGTVGTFVFSWYLFPQVLEHRQIVCAGIGFTYLAAFLLMCWRVKEGEYPLPPVTEKRGNFFKTFATYFREALSVPIYRNYLLMYAMVTAASTSASAFVTLFARNTIHLTMDDIGKVLAWAALGSAITYVPMGYLCDRIGAMRVAMISLVSLAVAWALGFFVAQDRTTWLAYSVVVAMLPSVGWNLGFNALTMQLFPVEKFGQLSSSLNVFGYGSIIAGNYLAGWFIDVVVSDYRMIFAWSASWFVLAIVPMALVYRDWKRFGGPHHYVPPLPA
jgi:maltose/moltooligosaccharide transporter